MKNTLDTENNIEDSIKITLPSSFNLKNGQGSKRIYKRPNLPITVVLGSAFLIYGVLYHAATFAVLGAVYSYNSSETTILMDIRDISYIIFTIVGVIIVPHWSARNIIVACLSVTTVCAIIVSFETHNFVLAEFLFFLTGSSFALVRLVAYWLISLKSKNKGQHARRIMHVEAMYLLGVALSYVLFPPYIKSSWTEVYWILFPFLVIIIGFQFLNNHSSDSSISESWKNEFRYACKSMNGLLVNSILILSLFCVLIASIIYVHFEEWISIFTTKLIDLTNRQFYDLNVLAMMFLVMAVSRLLIGIVLQRAGRFMIFAFCVFVLIALVLWNCDVFMNETIYPVSIFSNISPHSLFLPAIAFFLAPILPLIYAVIITQVSAKQQPLVIGLLLATTMLTKFLFTSLSTKLYTYFVDYTAFYLILIPLALLLVLFFLVYSDLNRDSKLFSKVGKNKKDEKI